MRIISVAVDGIQQAAAQGLFEWLASQDAHIICLQDLRLPEPVLSSRADFQLDGYFSYFFDAPQPEQNGVAIYTRDMPKAMMYGFGANNGEDMNGRYLQADFENVSICSLLAPSASDDDSQPLKDRFFRDLLAHFSKISSKRRDYIFCGSWNIAHRTIDVSTPDTCRDLSGFLPHEQQCLNQVFGDIGYADAFRLFNMDADEFTYWPAGKPLEGTGWRTDMQIVSKNLTTRVEYAVIYKNKLFSSHLPVIVDYDLETL
ncbi:exodeoxyribonuclease III [uncultured Porticoccus sp.]|uniref:exodeoxyribonuclease III n=1 Tax=uncultured Porticoccus sp. TaxID=1256050 RepID=UPI002618AA3C|nr:exodeoxyribonuclease III [uncultured Porticoccus sp.]